MLKQLAFLLTSVFFFAAFVQPVSAIYEPLSVANNKYGIHVFDANEVQKAAQLVNTSGGEWGYITVPIRANERDLEKWTKFMEECKRLKLIPILRIASFPVGDRWMAPNEWDLVDFANFLNELPWPTKNRYVMVYNEPNHKGEWGGLIYPEEYARVLNRAVDIFHERDEDFFVISAGMDAAAPNGPTTMDNMTYLQRMEQTVPGIFSKLDGFSSHAYGNPAFSTPPNLTSSMNVASYRQELEYLKSLGVENPPLFLTEVGWSASGIGDELTNKYYQQAFKDIWTDSNIVAITPFVLEAHDGPFEGFSFVREDGQWKIFAKSFQNIPKTAGKPVLVTNEQPPVAKPPVSNSQNRNRNGLQDLWELIINSFNWL